MSRAREVISYLVIIYLSISVGNRVLAFFQKFPTNIWIDRIICIIITAIIGGLLGCLLLPKNKIKQ
ncbi:hypothetical protein [Enterococcus sp. AZ192]|uniref:hypothetical protein n=1 Tax=unclassified Enterococcus TaxID=2608891 RepID=UPI003D265242